MTNGELAKGNGEQLGSDSSQVPVIRPTVEEVDLLADELVAEYSNPDYRKWYCSLIIKNGIERVNYWRERASSGKNPARLFSYYANQAKLSPADPIASVRTEANTDSTFIPDTVHLVQGNETREELRASIDQTLDNVMDYKKDDHWEAMHHKFHPGDGNKNV